LKTNARYRRHNSPPLTSVVSQINPIHLHAWFASAWQSLRLPTGFSPSIFPTKIYLIHHTCHMLRLQCFPLLYHSYIIFRKAQIITLLNQQSHSASCYIFSLRKHAYGTQRRILYSPDTDGTEDIISSIFTLTTSNPILKPINSFKARNDFYTHTHLLVKPVTTSIRILYLASVLWINNSQVPTSFFHKHWTCFTGNRIYCQISVKSEKGQMRESGKESKKWKSKDRRGKELNVDGYKIYMRKSATKEYNVGFSGRRS
jgi:hypothetical protein